MFAIRVTYLMGRVYSSVFDDGDTKVRPEWPPHPSRLFSALVAAWGDSGAEEQLRPALEWIEQQEPPRIHAADCSTRKLVQAFVPVNDSASLPEDRSRKARGFPSGTLEQPDVYFVWNSEPPSEITEGLRRILERTSSLGHSASLVEARIAASVPETRQTIWQPDRTGQLRMRVPSAGRLRDLVSRYQQFQRDPSKIHRPSAGATALYSAPETSGRKAPCGVFGQMIVFRRDNDPRDDPRTGLRSTLSITNALRGAVMSHAPQPVAECLSGHAPESTSDHPVRSERPHIAFVPLPFVDYQHATGEVMGVAALLPRTLTGEERDLCWQVLSGIDQLKMPWGTWHISMADAEEHRRALRAETWTRSHRVWSTVTPFVFDRFPKDPYGKEAEQVVRDAFTRAGFPEPVEVDLHYNPWHLGVPKAAVFPAAPTRPGKPRRYHCHVRARFAQEIQGPVVAGAGRFYGYGLFLALRNEGR